MLKFISTMAFAIAAVSGNWPTQDHDRSLPFPVQPPQTQIEARPVLLPQTGLPVGILRARPCHRRTFGSPGVSSDSVRTPVSDVQQQFLRQSVQPNLKPQSLTENRASDADENSEAVNSPRNPESLNKLDKNSNPTYYSENRNLDENERKRDTQDSVELDTTDQNNSPHVHIEDEHNHHHHHHHSSSSREESHEHTHDSHECETHEGSDEHKKHDESEHHSDGTGKAAPADVHEEAVKLISKCVEEAKADNSLEDYQGDSRRSNSPTEAKNKESQSTAVISPKSKPTDYSNKDEDAKSSTNKVKQSSDLDRLDPQVYNPAKDAVTYQSNPKVSLLQNGRVCYACSTYFDPSCWRPNATTTVKYCYKNNNACVTRTFKVEGKTILTRDCGHTCNEDNPYGVGPKHTSCTMCHTDMCNSAYAINGLNVLLVTFVISAVTFTLQ